MKRIIFGKNDGRVCEIADSSTAVTETETMIYIRVDESLSTGFSKASFDIAEVEDVPDGNPLDYVFDGERLIYDQIDEGEDEPAENPGGVTDEVVAEIEQNYRNRIAKEVEEIGY